MTIRLALATQSTKGVGLVGSPGLWEEKLGDGSFTPHKSSLDCDPFTFLQRPISSLQHIHSQAPAFPSTQRQTQAMESQSRPRHQETNTSQAAEEVTQKYGLEAGLWKTFSSKEDDKDVGETKKSRTDEAKEPLAKYGGAYLATSISLSLVAFALCSLLSSAVIGVAAFLQKVGISTNEAGETVGTFALAYAAHKAASPIRFPPTVALTPIVAGCIGSFKKSDNEER